MPIPLDIRQVDEGGGIEAALIKTKQSIISHADYSLITQNFKELKKDTSLPI